MMGSTYLFKRVRQVNSNTSDLVNQANPDPACLINSFDQLHVVFVTCRFIPSFDGGIKLSFHLFN
ncbi:hypothetical protein Hanom_Chr01g00051511 [Helianthus anomalus]